MKDRSKPIQMGWEIRKMGYNAKTRNTTESKSKGNWKVDVSDITN